jgi:replicative DNA helicase
MLLPDAIIEKLILKRVLSDRTYNSTLQKKFDVRWFDNREVGIAVDCALLYFNLDGNKNRQIVDPNTLGLICRRAMETGRYATQYSERSAMRNYRNYAPDAKISDVVLTITEARQLDIKIDDNVCKEDMQRYLKKKFMSVILLDSVEQLERGEADCADVIVEQFEEFQRLSFDHKSMGMQYFKNEDQIQHWDYICNPEAKLSTGWPTLDVYTNGGFPAKGKFLGIFCGQPGLGKSLFLSNITVNFLAQNKKVVVISLEMSEDVYAQRFDAHISEDDINNLKSTKDKSLATINRFYESHPESNLVIKEFPPRSVTTPEIDDYLRSLRDNGIEFDVVVVDYLNLVLPKRKHDNMYQSVLSVAEELRALSYVYEVPFISASQVNRQGINTENVGLENISESGGIAHTVDFCGMLFQSDDDRQTDPPQIRMRISKNRLGEFNHLIPFALNTKNLTLKDLEGMDDASGIAQDNNISTMLSGISDDLSGFGPDLSQNASQTETESNGEDLEAI